MQTSYELVKALSFQKEGSKVATCSIKIGEIVGTITFDEKSDKSIDIGFSDNLKIAQSAGIILEISSLLGSYKLMLEHYNQIFQFQKMQKAAENYRNLHKYYSEAVKYLIANKRKFPGLTFEFERESEYTDRNWKNLYMSNPKPIKLFYQNQELEVIFDRSSKPSYKVRGVATEWKERRYASFEAAIAKVTTIIDDYLKANASKIEAKEKAAIKVLDTLNFFRQQLPSYSSSIESSEVYGEWHPGRNMSMKSTKVTKFFVTKNNRKYSLEYSDKDTCHFASLGRLTFEQIRQILDII